MMNFDANFWAIIGTGISIIGLIYAFIRNFQNDMDSRFDKMEKKFDKKFEDMDKRVMETNKRMDGVDNILLKRTENQSKI